jgi:hypothetical protein
MPAKVSTNDKLEGFGYDIRIPSWGGQLGNHIMQLSYGLHVALETRSRLIVPSHPILEKREFNFCERLNSKTNEVIESSFRNKGECFQFALNDDAVRRQILQKYVLPQLLRKPYFRKIFDILRPDPDTFVSHDTLVINIRSGRDIFRTSPPPQNDYMQPPLSFYTHVIRKYKYKKALIVTEKERANPVIEALLNAKLDCEIRLKHRKSVQNDIATILNAHHLIAAHSTFTWFLALMSKKLSVVYQPETFFIRNVPDITVRVFRYNNYINLGEWECSPSQLDLMISHPEYDVHELTQDNFGGQFPTQSMLT